MGGLADRLWLRPGDFLQRPQYENSRQTKTLT